MVFSSISFLCCFLPILLAVYYLTPRRFRRLRNDILLCASLGFYAWGGLRYLPLLLLCICINYVCGWFAAPAEGRGQGQRKAAVCLAVVAGIGLLFVFKYVNFFARTLNAVGATVPVPEIVLPIGISFFTFQGLSYVIDVYGDSFTNAVECVLYYGFNQMRSLDFRYYTEMSLGEYIETWQPDYVVCIRDYEQLANPTFNGGGAEFQP